MSETGSPNQGDREGERGRLPPEALDVLEASDDTLIVLDRAWRFVYLNGQALRDAGEAAEQLLGRTIWEKYPALLGTDLETQYRRAMAEQVAVHFEMRGVLTGRWLEVHAYPSAQALTVYGRDVSDRKRAELALREGEERFQNFMDNSPAVAWMKDEQLRFVYVNRTWEQRFRRRLLEVRGLTDLDMRPAEVGEQLRGHDRAVLASGKAMEFEEVVPDPDGSLRHWQVYKFPFQDTAGTRYVGGMAVDITDRKQVEWKLQESAGRLQTLSRRLLEAQEVERRRIAGELHDEVGQTLTAVSLRLQLARACCGEEALPHLDEAVAVVAQAIRQVRGLSLDLRPAMLDDFGLAAALRWYTGRVAEPAGLSLHFEDTTGCTRPPPVVETACFRVAQEALTNVARHARARQVWVELRHEADLFHLAVHDDGIGFDVAQARRQAAQGESYGLLGMQERVDLLGGRLEVESAPGQGTAVRASFPLAGEPFAAGGPGG